MKTLLFSVVLLSVGALVFGQDCMVGGKYIFNCQVDSKLCCVRVAGISSADTSSITGTCHAKCPHLTRALGEVEVPKSGPPKVFFAPINKYLVVTGAYAKSVPTIAPQSSSTSVTVSSATSSPKVVTQSESRVLAPVHASTDDEEEEKVAEESDDDADYSDSEYDGEPSEPSAPIVKGDDAPEAPALEGMPASVGYEIETSIEIGVASVRGKSVCKALGEQAFYYSDRFFQSKAHVTVRQMQGNGTFKDVEIPYIRGEADHADGRGVGVRSILEIVTAPFPIGSVLFNSARKAVKNFLKLMDNTGNGLSTKPIGAALTLFNSKLREFGLSGDFKLEFLPVANGAGCVYRVIKSQFKSLRPQVTWGMALSNFGSIPPSSAPDWTNSYQTKTSLAVACRRGAVKVAKTYFATAGDYNRDIAGTLTILCISTQLVLSDSASHAGDDGSGKKDAAEQLIKASPGDIVRVALTPSEQAQVIAAVKTHSQEMAEELCTEFNKSPTSGCVASAMRDAIKGSLLPQADDDPRYPGETADAYGGVSGQSCTHPARYRYDRVLSNVNKPLLPFLLKADSTHTRVPGIAIESRKADHTTTSSIINVGAGDIDHVLGEPSDPNLIKGFQKLIL